MDIISLFIIALGLSADSFAVSVSSGIIIPDIKWKQSLKIAFFLGIFQALMPVLGWLIGFSFKDLISNYDHWIAFGLLLLVGLKMVIDGAKSKHHKKINPAQTMVLIGLSIATTIDALIVGVGFAFLDVNITWASIMIGVVTFSASISGIYLGCRFCKLINYKLDMIAGFVLIAIGLKILLEHTVWGG
jgi:putative Mn2+ efflux pump MntP